MEYIETPIFTREIRRLLPDDEYHRLQIALVLRPDAGDLIHGRGVAPMKNEDFERLAQSVKQAGQIRQGRKRPGRVFRFSVPDVKKTRKRLDMSQAEFATMIGVSPRTLQNWEQGRRTPDGPAQALLRVTARNPEAVLEALHS